MRHLELFPNRLSGLVQQNCVGDARVTKLGQQSFTDAFDHSATPQGQSPSNLQCGSFHGNVKQHSSHTRDRLRVEIRKPWNEIKFMHS